MKLKLLYYVIFETRAGWIGALSSNGGLLKTTFPQKSQKQALLSLNLETLTPTYSDEIFKHTVEFYISYFNGDKIIFNGKLDLSSATCFQRAVWEATLRIPYGETRSYSQIAQKIGNPLSCRAVGNALGQNPMPIIIPCHRVIASSNKIGGFSKDLSIKIFLLNLENKNNL
jgi:methylated-DNA-[protein]-cysteine S-methyltransferase